MAQPFDIKFSDTLTRALQAFKEDAKDELQAEIGAAAKEWEDLAVNSARDQDIFDVGGLVGGITSKHEGGLNSSVTSAAGYSAYHEWGTITHVQVPADQADFATQFKGEGIKKTGGIYARPFFFIHKDKVLKNLAKRLTT